MGETPSHARALVHRRRVSFSMINHFYFLLENEMKKSLYETKLHHLYAMPYAFSFIYLIFTLPLPLFLHICLIYLLSI